MVPLQKFKGVAPSAERPVSDIIAEANGWYLRTDKGELVGPFASLRDLEDYLDARDH